MRVPRSSVFTAALGCALAFGVDTAAFATDQPISGAKLQLKKKDGKEQLLFLSKDPSFLFPAIGGADDPQAVGATVEVVTQPGSAGTLSMPAGAGKPGWTAKPGTHPSHKFDNKLAPGGISAVRTAMLKQGKQLKILAKSLGGATLSSFVTGVSIRITIGSLRSCARFDAALFKRSDETMLLATNSSASVLADCSDESIGIPPGCNSSAFPTCGGPCYGDGVCTAGFGACKCVSPSMPCGGTNPTCNGICGAGEECVGVGVDYPSCVCIPTGATPCGSPGAPTCGGACPVGEVCRPVYGLPFFGAHLGCDCAPPGACASTAGKDCGLGFACGPFPPTGDTCLPMFCGTYPTCGGNPCGDGGECGAVNVPESSISTCLCAVPAPCDAGCGGYSCPGGQVCTLASGTCSCGAP